MTASGCSVPATEMLSRLKWHKPAKAINSARIRQRTLVICGRQDALTPPKFHRELADEIPGAHLVTIAHGAHLVMAESAESFNRTVLQFLGEGRDRFS